MPVQPYGLSDPLTGVRRRGTRWKNPLNEPYDPAARGNALAGQVSEAMAKRATNPMGVPSDVAGLNTNIVKRAGEMVNPDTSDIDLMEAAQYNKALSRYEQALKDRSGSLSAEAIQRGVYTQGGELDAASRRAFLESYAQPLGQTTEMLTAQSATDRANRRLSGLNAAQGVSSAQSSRQLAFDEANRNILNDAGGFAQGQQGLGEGQRQFDIGAYGYDPNENFIDASGSYGNPLNAANVPRTTLASQELGLRGRAQTQSEQAQAGGYYDKEGKWVPTEAARATGVGERFTEAGLTGTLDGRQTLEAQNAALQRAIARGRETGQFVDPTTGEAYQTQAALEQAFRQRLSTAGLTGTLDGQKTLTSIGQEADIELRRASTFGRSGPITPGTKTEEARRNEATESLQGRGIAVTEDNLGEEIRRSKVNEAIQAATVFGAGLVLPDGRPITVRNGRDAYDGEGNYIGRYDPNDGTLVFVDGRGLKVQVPTLAQQGQTLESELGRREASRREQELYGGSTTRDASGALTFHPTLSAKAQQFSQQATTAGLTGKLPLLAADGTPARDAKGQQIYGDTLDAQRLGLQTIETFGGKEVFRINPTTGKTERAWQDTLAGGKLALDRENSGMDRAIAVGRETGKFIDPNTYKEYDTQAALEQAFKQRILTEEVYGGYTDPKTNKTYLTLEGQIQASRLTGKVVDPTGAKNTDGTPKLIDTIDALNAAVDRAAKQGDATGVYTDPLTNTKSSTLQKKIFSLEEEQIYGGRFVDQEDGEKKWQGTLAWEQMDRNQRLAYATLSEDTRRTKVKEKIALADQLGWSDSAPGKVAWGDWAQAYRDSTEGKPYDVAMDLDGNGRVDLEDMRYGQTNNLLANPGETFETLQAKQVTSQINAVSDTLKLDRDKLNEVVRQSTQDFWTGQRDYMTRATGYVYDAYGRPIEKVQPDENQAFMYEDVKKMFSVMSPSGVTRADKEYNPAFDVNDDGHITESEFWNTLDSATALATGEWGEKKYTAKKIKTQVSTIDREQFKDDQDRFNQTFNTQIEQFAAQLGIDKEKLDKMDDALKAQLIGVLASAVMGAAGAYLGRSRSTSDNTAGTGGGGGASAGISFGTGGVNINLGPAGPPSGFPRI